MKNFFLMLGCIWLLVVGIATAVGVPYIFYAVFTSGDTIGMPWLIPFFLLMLIMAASVAAIPGLLLVGLSGVLKYFSNRRDRKTSSYSSKLPTLGEIMEMSKAEAARIKLTDEQVSVLLSAYPNLPVEYVTYLLDVGWGRSANGHMVYKAPVLPRDIYGSDFNAKEVIILGDDLQGCCFGYDLATSTYGEATSNGTWRAWPAGKSFKPYVEGQAIRKKTPNNTGPMPLSP